MNNDNFVAVYPKTVVQCILKVKQLQKFTVIQQVCNNQTTPLGEQLVWRYIQDNQ